MPVPAHNPMDLSQQPPLDTPAAADTPLPGSPPQRLPFLGSTAGRLAARGLIFPLALALICLAAFVPLIYRLGFYWDDWPSIWFLHAFGTGSFRQGFSADRPLLAWVFMLTTALIGESPLGWQLFGVAARLLAGLAVWAIGRAVWPERRRLAGATAILFTLYPGFTQQYISVTYANAFLVFSLYLFSLAGMLWAVRLGRRGQTGKQALLLAGSIAAAGFSLFTTEYFAGLELLRPVLLWLVLEQADPGQLPAAKRWQAQAGRTLRYWLPYLVLFIVFVALRLSDKTPRARVVLFDDLRTNPAAAITGLLVTLGQDFWETNLLAWVHGLDPARLNDHDTSVLLLFAASILTSAGLALAWGRWGEAPALEAPALEAPAHPAGSSAWRWLPLLLGIYTFFIAGWPAWITNLRIELFFPWDRLTLMTMLGSSLLAAGLLELAAGRRWLWAGLLAVLVGLAAGAQFQYRLAYRQEWLAQQNFFWQLSWRIPALQPGTLLLTSEIPFTYYTDNSLSAPLNWIYAPPDSDRLQDGRAQMFTLLYDIEARLGKGLPSLEPGVPVHEPYRAAVFDGSTDQAVVLFYDPPRCLKVIDPAVDRFLPVKPLYIREATPRSRLDLIVPHPGPNQAATPPSAWFGPEPPASWCTYFEKAELYNQAGEWDKAAEMADKALKTRRHYTEKNVAELNAFIEAYAHTGKWQKAVELTGDAYQTWDKMQYVLCDVWTRIQQTTVDSPERQAALQKIRNLFACTLP